MAELNCEREGTKSSAHLKLRAYKRSAHRMTTFLRRDVGVDIVSAVRLGNRRVSS